MVNSLSDNQVQQIAAAIEAGRRPRVYFTADAVGMEEGRSGVVVEVASPAEPDYLHVRPTGSRDTLAFSPTELTLSRPARRRSAPQRPRADDESPSLFENVGSRP
ncbi:hypothetical protein ACWDYH_32690 [Nocardia goodfellowii]|uniref:DUF1918 domain-containing protein n=1 Tax=Nocardia goodfellowii TaxID=882446 RepID=A0ABS4QNP8_9NOCA|nr:hypothetical protein [Nocardia goodfellowii]MBP2193335.1 hypothetical protein [Nocardia goodfellowii]